MNAERFLMLPAPPTAPDPGSDVATRWYVVHDVRERGRIVTRPLTEPFRSPDLARAELLQLRLRHSEAYVVRCVTEVFAAA